MKFSRRSVIACFAFLSILSLALPQLSAASTPFAQNLQLRDTSGDVARLQQFLNAEHFLIAQSGPGSPGNETTTFGLFTYQALTLFQSAHGLPATGFFGPLTRALIVTLARSSTGTSTLSSSVATSTVPSVATSTAVAPWSPTAPAFSALSSTTSGYIPGVTPLPGYKPGQIIFIGGGAPAPATPPASPPAPAPYVAKAVHFDGNTWLYSSDALGAVNGPRGTFSFWAYQAHSGDLAQNIAGVIDTGSSCAFILQYPGGIGVPSDSTFNGGGFTYSPDGTACTTELNGDTTQAMPVGTWYHILFSWNTNFPAHQKLAALYVNDVLVPFDDALHGTEFPNDDTTSAFDIQYNDTLWAIGQWGYNIVHDSIGAGPFMVGDMADLYVNTTDSIVQSDNTISTSDRRKFSTTDNKPVDLGSNGSTPTGHAPTIYLTGNASQWPNNAAGTGSFNEIGTLTNATTSPSD